MSGGYEQMNRLIHAGLRRDLNRMGHVLQEPLSHERREALGRRIAWLVEFLHHHHRGEEEAIWPRALHKRPELGVLVQEMEVEHDALSAAADGLRDAAAAYAEDGSESTRLALIDAVEAMRHACLPHLEHEESVAVPQLVQILDDREWAQVDKDFRRNVSLKDLGWIAMWVLDDLDPQDARVLLSELPGPVLRFMTWRWGPPYDREASLAWGEQAGARSRVKA
jgi:hemerythrin-like domain-containing protein